MNDEKNIDVWVTDRLSSLEAVDGPVPGAETLLDRIKERERAHRILRRRLVTSGGSVFLCCAAIAAAVAIHSRREAPPRPAPVPAPAAAAAPERPPIAEPPAPAIAAKSISVPKTATPVALVHNFKELGSPDAPVGCEIYTDLECPPCATFWAETVPRIVAEYVDTGKVKLIRRDFPLPHHQYARLAARYANAAGMIGKYDVAFDRLFATQSLWHLDGDPESQLATVLSPDDMEKLKKLIGESPEPDESIMRDAAAAADDHIDQTPAIVIVGKGRRRKIAGPITFPAMKSYLDELLE
jgi:protein-disulfide isomerase